MTTPLSTLLQGAIWSDAGLSVDVPEDWLQGRSAYGGVQLAIVSHAMRQLVPYSVPLRTLQATLIAPLAGRLVVRPRILRTGKNVTHVEARFTDENDATLLHCIAVFGNRRTSQVSVVPVQPEVQCEAPITMPFIAGLTPAFTQHFDGKLLRGAFPFTGSTATECSFSLGIRDSGPFTEAHLIAFADYPPPVAFSHLKQFAPGSTLTWMLELFTDDFSDLPLSGYRIDAELLAARDGYTSQSATVWSPNGQALARGQQCMMVFG